jgi:hypothetical protein
MTNKRTGNGKNNRKDRCDRKSLRDDKQKNRQRQQHGDSDDKRRQQKQ